MRIGICTTDFESAMSADELFGIIANMGFECVQLAFSSVKECDFQVSNQIEIPGSVSAYAVERIRTAAQKHKIDIVAVNGTFNMAHPDAQIREEGLARFDGFLRGVSEVGCNMVSVCSGSRSLAGLWTYSPVTSEPSAYSDMLDVMRRAVSMAEARGITLAIETEASNVIDSPKKARQTLDAIASPNLKMILDCANLFHLGEAARQNVRAKIDAAIDCFGREIALAHGKDILESPGIDFCGAGEGIVDFPYMIEKLREAGFAGDMVLHGIYRPENMPRCLAFMRNCLS